jgi:hypothetical protein
MAVMSRRRKLLLCSAPAALALAALVWALARDGRSEAEKRAERVRVGMTLGEAGEILGVGEPRPYPWPGTFPWYWDYPDGSAVRLRFDFEGEGEGRAYRITAKEVLPRLPWHERVRDRLRQLGLPV